MLHGRVINGIKGHVQNSHGSRQTHILELAEIPLRITRMLALNLVHRQAEDCRYLDTGSLQACDEKVSWCEAQLRPDILPKFRQSGAQIQHGPC